MSLLTFAAFPREVDTCCLKDMECANKRESDRNELPAVETAYLGYTDSISIYDIYEGISFENVFENEFVYFMDADLYKECFIETPEMEEERLRQAGYTIEDVLDEIEKQDGVRMSKEEYFDQKRAFLEMVVQNNIKSVIHCRKQLYKLLKHNLQEGEFVELYGGWDGGYTKPYKRIKFGPPKRIVELTVEDVLTSELLDWGEDLKIIIRHRAQSTCI